MSFWRALKMLLTLHCKESAHLLSDACERDLAPAERWAVRLHHLSCRVCRRLARQLRQIDQVAKTRGEQGNSMTPEARARIAATLAKRGEGN